MQDVRRAIGPDREAWKTALDAELNSLRESGAIDVVTHVPHGIRPSPTKMVHTLKPIPNSTARKKKARACACVNFQKKKATELLYTASSGISSIRAVLAEAAQDPDNKRYLRPGCEHSVP